MKEKKHLDIYKKYGVVGFGIGCIYNAIANKN